MKNIILSVFIIIAAASVAQGQLSIILNAQCLEAIELKFFGYFFIDTVSYRPPLLLTSVLFNQPLSMMFSAEYYDYSKPTVVYIPGYLDSLYFFGPKAVITKYLSNKSKYNVAFFDWTACAQKTPDQTAQVFPGVILRAKSLFQNLQKQGLDVNKLHLIGYGLGTYIAGSVGSSLNGNVDRITGLDPASMGGVLNTILSLITFPQLSRSNAKFVDVIHTDSAFVGENKTIGHVDFWPNGGFQQNGCASTVSGYLQAIQNLAVIDQVACNHFRSWRYYAESVYAPPTVFTSRLCVTSPTNTYNNVNCNSATTVSMGFNANLQRNYLVQNAPRNFYLQTKSSSPFSLS